MNGHSLMMKEDFLQGVRDEILANGGKCSIDSLRSNAMKKARLDAAELGKVSINGTDYIIVNPPGMDVVGLVATAIEDGVGTAVAESRVRKAEAVVDTTYEDLCHAQAAHEQAKQKLYDASVARGDDMSCFDPTKNGPLANHGFGLADEVYRIEGDHITRLDKLHGIPNHDEEE